MAEGDIVGAGVMTTAQDTVVGVIMTTAQDIVVDATTVR